MFYYSNFMNYLIGFVWFVNQHVHYLSMPMCPFNQDIVALRFGFFINFFNNVNIIGLFGFRFYRRLILLSYYTIGKIMYINNSYLNLCRKAFSHCNRWAVDSRMYDIECLLIYVPNCKQIKKELPFSILKMHIVAGLASEGVHKRGTCPPQPSTLGAQTF